MSNSTCLCGPACQGAGRHADRPACRQTGLPVGRQASPHQSWVYLRLNYVALRIDGASIGPDNDVVSLIV